jgi:hypothetical protein
MGRYPVTYVVQVDDVVTNCSGTITIGDQVDDLILGVWSMRGSATCPSISGAFEGTIDSVGSISIPNLFADILESGTNDCIEVGRVLMEGELQRDDLALSGSGLIRCSGFDLTASVEISGTRG